MRPRPAKLWLVAFLCASAARAAGVYDSVPIAKDEEHLIRQADELGGYFAAQSLLYTDAHVLSLVRRVGHEIRPRPSDDYIEYEFFVLRDPSPNAFALPNGHVYVHTGMIARLRDEAQLAGLLAHEISHVAGHHGILEHRSQKKRAIAGMVLGGLGGWGGLVAVGLQASVYGFSRDLEQEADDHAVALLRDTRYDAHALPEVFDILGEDYEGFDQRVPTIWSTHPEIGARAVTSRALVAGLPVGERPVDDFEQAMLTLQTITVQDYIQDDYAQTALALAESLLERHPDDPRLLLLLGDAWQGMGAQRRLAASELSNADKKQIRRDRARKTRAQRLAEQLVTEDGQKAYAENLARAEDCYRRALAADAALAAAHRGLGEVYEQLARNRESAEQYLAYVRAVPEAADRPIVVGRLRALSAKLKE
ncbi:MAG TPA: M48 family metalloprotease [Gammaproteobacteria bacterium]|nr:M48 family metalloprotease [Gammaproteobacteria bacterium]